MKKKVKEYSDDISETFDGQIKKLEDQVNELKEDALKHAEKIKAAAKKAAHVTSHN